MDEERFWTLLDAARPAEGADETAHAALLRAVLEPLPRGELVSFAHHFAERVRAAHRDEVWAVLRLLEPLGPGDDGFEYACRWLVGRGRAAYERVLADPFALAAYVDEATFPHNEGLGYVAEKLAAARGGAELWDEPLPAAHAPAAPAPACPTDAAWRARLAALGEARATADRFGTALLAAAEATGLAPRVFLAVARTGIATPTLLRQMDTRFGPAGPDGTLHA